MRNIYRSPFEVIETRINNLVCCVISGIFDTCCCETAISDFWCSRCQIELPVCIEINGSKRTFRNFLNQTGCIQNLYVHHCIVCGSFYGNFSIYRECPACCLGIYLCKLIAVPCHIKQCICSVCIQNGCLCRCGKGTSNGHFLCDICNFIYRLWFCFGFAVKFYVVHIKVLTGYGTVNADLTGSILTYFKGIGCISHPFVPFIWCDCNRFSACCQCGGMCSRIISAGCIDGCLVSTRHQSFYCLRTFVSFRYTCVLLAAHLIHGGLVVCHRSTLK